MVLLVSLSFVFTFLHFTVYMLGIACIAHENILCVCTCLFIWMQVSFVRLNLIASFIENGCFFIVSSEWGALENIQV